MRVPVFGSIVAAAVVWVGVFASSVQVRAADWPMWCGRADRNMVSAEKNLPAGWDLASKKNVKWVAELGSQTFGAPVVGGGKVFIGTNNGKTRNPKITGDKAILLCFAESDGKFLWQAVHDKLPSGDAHDFPEIGLCGSVSVVGDRLYYVSNRCELVCLDTEGFRDGENDGPIQDERLAERIDADFVWKLDMMKRFGVWPHQATASSPVVAGDLLFVVTGNGIDMDHEKVTTPQAPSFLAVNRRTGKVVWSNNTPGSNILDGQWSSPACGLVNGKGQVVFAGGDGWLYSFQPATGKLLWKFNCRSKEPPLESDGFRAGNTLVATPVIHDNKVFVAVGQDPENGDGAGRLWAIDATKTGDITETGVVWQVGGEEFGRSISTVAIRDGLLYATEVTGYLHCLDAAAGKRHYRHDLLSPVWGSPLVVDGKVYIGNEDGDVTVFRQGKQAKVLATNVMNDGVHGSVVAANGVLYVTARAHLVAVAQPAASSRPKAVDSDRKANRSGDWPMFRGNPQLTGVAADTLPEKLEILWKFEAPEAIESSAAIVGDQVYLGCDDGLLYVLDLATGKARWTYDTKSLIRSSPGVYRGAVYFGDDDGVFHAVDIQTHKVRWTFQTDAEIISSANFAGDRVFFGSYDAYLYCLSTRDGKVIWKCETDGRVHGTPGVAGDNVLVAGCDGQLRVVAQADGQSVGLVNMEAYSGASAAVLGPHVYVGTMDNQVLGMDWTRNKIEWVYEHPERKFPFYASAAVTEDVVVIGGRDKLVHALDPKTGKARWTFETKGRIDASPVIAGNRVFVGSLDGHLYGLDLRKGKLRWTFETGSAILASAAVARARLVVGAEDGVVYCFGKK